MSEQPFTIPEGAELLPADANVLDPDTDLALSGQLSDFDPGSAADEARPPVFGKTWAWDEDTQRFQRYGGSPAPIRGRESAVQYAKNLLSIVRLSSPIFDDDIGLDDPWLLINQPLDGATKSEWAQSIRDALGIEQRFSVTGNFEFEYNNDGNLYYSFTLVIDDTDEVPVEGVITAG